MDILRRHAIDYFSTLYTVYNYSPRRFPINGRFPQLEESILSELVANVTLKEVRRAVFNMSLLKALGVDGLHAKFYQVNWNVVGLAF